MASARHIQGFKENSHGKCGGTRFSLVLGTINIRIDSCARRCLW